MRPDEVHDHALTRRFFKPCVEIAEALPEVPDIPVRRLAYCEDSGFLAVAYNSVVQIFSKGRSFGLYSDDVENAHHDIIATEPSGEVIWRQMDVFSSANSNAGLVTALRFIQHPTWSLLVGHALSGITYVPFIIARRLFSQVCIVFGKARESENP